MRKFYLHFAALVAMLLCVSFGAKAVGWPANYQGVMLQGFYWDSYKGSNDTKWTTLTSMADELSKYFSLIWVPNSARANGENGGGNGYMPIYWFTNHNCAFGTEAQLKTMISTFKAKGVGFIEDVVVNHRVGKSNWYDFPSETWNGKTYYLTNGAICSTDEMWRQGGQGCPYSRGNSDTGEDFDGARDLDHTNATVQDNVKNYCKFLIDDLGYVGFRLDMVKGYSGQYTKIYNQYSKPTFSVGEYWDGSYDAVAAWIEATGKESAAFDFPFKYQVNKAFANNDLTELCWKANGVTDQPAGLIHFGYPQLAVTFIDNHDTYRDGSKFNGNVVAANAFMLCSPGTPCVFWLHYTQNKSAIQALINVRNQVGVHNMSSVRVLKTTRDCYMAEVTGTKGKLIVRIGNTSDGPSDSSYQLKCSGTGYSVWATTSGGVTVPDIPSGQAFTVYFKNDKNWTTPHIHYWGGQESTWPGVAMSKVDGTTDVWSYTVPAGTTGILFNAGDGDATKTQDFVAQANHIYTTSGDQGAYGNGGGNGGNGGGNTENPNSPYNVYFDNSSSNWTTPHIHYWGGQESTWPGVAMSKHEGDVWVYTVPAGTTGILFNAGDGDATKTQDFVAQANHIYTTSGDQGAYGNGGGNGGNTENPNSPYKVYFDNSSSNWTTPHIHYWGGQESTWPGDPMSKHEGDVWVYTVPAGTTGLLFNAGDGDATKTQDFVAMANHIYTTSGDQGAYGNGGGGNGGNDNPVTPDVYPATLYLIGNINGENWNTANPIPATGKEGLYSWSNVTFDDAGEGYAYFSFLTSTGADWDTVNEFDRYGSVAFNSGAENTDLAVGEEATIVYNPAQVSAMGATAWKIKAGQYNVEANLQTMKVKVSDSTAVGEVEIDDNSEVEYYNLQGVRVYNPSNGIFIQVKGHKATKVVI